VNWVAEKYYFPINDFEKHNYKNQCDGLYVLHSIIRVQHRIQDMLLTDIVWSFKKKKKIILTP
jgi:hypothetical protein